MIEINIVLLSKWRSEAAAAVPMTVLTPLEFGLPHVFDGFNILHINFYTFNPFLYQ